MNFSINVDELKKQREKQELDESDENNQNNGSYYAISQEINEILDTLIQNKSPNDATSADNLITELFEKMSTQDAIPFFLIHKNNFCDHLMHFLSSPFTYHTLCTIHDIFKMIYISSEESAFLAFKSSYFHYVVNYFYESKFENDDMEREEKEAVFSRVIHSLRFGIQSFIEIDSLFLSDIPLFKERFKYLISECGFSESVVHELICLTDSVVSIRQDKDIISFITSILLDYFLDPIYTKVCCDTFIRCAKFSFLYDVLSSIFFSNDDESTDLIDLILTILSSQDQTYDIKAKVKSFLLLRYILFLFQSNTDDVNSSELTVKIITVDFLNNNVVHLLDPSIVIKPKYLEMAINSILQISLNDPSIPSVICESSIFQTIIDLVNNPTISFMVGISCRLLFASLLRTDDPELQVYVFENTFVFLEDLFDSNEPAWIIEAIDAIMIFLEKMDISGNNKIISKILKDDDFSWVRECLDDCLTSPVERIAHTAQYITNQYFSTNEAEQADDE